MTVMDPVVKGEVVRLRRQVEQLTRLKRFIAPEISSLILSDDGGERLRSHHRDVVVVFFDLRGFTSFVQRADPDQVIEMLRAYHRLVGRFALAYQATVERFAGDGVMLVLNHPVVVAEPARGAVRMALAVREAFDAMRADWPWPGTELEIGTGISQGVATVGAIGSDDRSDYAAIGPVTNLAARLCAEAGAAQILVCERVATATAATVTSRPLGDLPLRGFHGPVPVFAVEGIAGSHVGSMVGHVCA